LIAALQVDRGIGERGEPGYVGRVDRVSLLGEVVEMYQGVTAHLVVDSLTQSAG
jgi:hypothetical protein